MTVSTDFSEIKVTRPPLTELEQSPSKEDSKPNTYTNSNSEKYTSEDLTDAEVKRHYENTILRKTYAYKAFKVVKKSLWGWAILLSVYGVIKFLTRHDNGGFEIFSDQVLIAITTATTLNIFAAFLSLIRGIFPSIKEDKKEK